MGAVTRGSHWASDCGTGSEWSTRLTRSLPVSPGPGAATDSESEPEGGPGVGGLRRRGVDGAAYWDWRPSDTAASTCDDEPVVYNVYRSAFDGPWTARTSLRLHWAHCQCRPRVEARGHERWRQTPWLQCHTVGSAVVLLGDNRIPNFVEETQTTVKYWQLIRGGDRLVHRREPRRHASMGTPKSELMFLTVCLPGSFPLPLSILRFAMPFFFSTPRVPRYPR